MSDMQEAIRKAGLGSNHQTKKSRQQNDGGKVEFLNFYKDEGKKELKPYLVDKFARDWVEKFIERRAKDELTMTQLRKFYGEVLSIEEKLKVNKFEIVLSQIKMIKSKAAYAINPKNPKIPKSFKNFLDQMVDSIKDAQDFKAFKMIFEAIVGFSAEKGVKQ